jgi:hypothetical protein
MSSRRKFSRSSRPALSTAATPRPVSAHFDLEQYTRMIADNIVANIDPAVGFVLITSRKDHATCDHTVIHTFTQELAQHLLEDAMDHL